MALLKNKFEEEINIIQYRQNSFHDFLKNKIFDEDSWNVLNKISQETTIYIFSGIIRNFFLEYEDFRDVDIVLKNENISNICSYFQKAIVRKNSFGGYKINTDMLSMDIWALKDTWGIKHESKPSTVESLIDSSFFNFSCIVYDFNKKKFIYSDKFLSFLKFHILDVVYEKNPNIPLCIINSIYYKEKFKLSISDKLQNWIINMYSEQVDLDSIQIKHFGKIIYNKEYINSFINKLCKTSKNFIFFNKLV